MSSTLAWTLQVALMALVVGGTGWSVSSSVGAAEERLLRGEAEVQAAAEEAAPLVRAAAAEVDYCSPQMKAVLRRVLTNCGLIGGGRRGCQPGELRKVAQIADEDFNALFRPLSKRAGILLFDVGKHDLDAAAKELAAKRWADRRGGSYFFILGRASTDGATATNRALSHRRVNSALFHLQERFDDPEMEQRLGLLWLGEEYAQLGTEFCSWDTSRSGSECNEETINRSVILSWIDCRL